jgi:predicted N-acyltransferase
MTTTPPELTARFLTGLDDIPAPDWDAITGGDYPFLRHRFLLGMEKTGCTTADSGWQPCHLVLAAGKEQRVVAVMPLYLKSHSYGEYVFDWSWAQAWERSGLRYYPKLVTAIPFTPATGPRLCAAPQLSKDAAWAAALAAVKRLATASDISSWHCLFPTEATADTLSDLGMHRRFATQFHWHNAGYASFDAFLAGLNSRKRKSIRRERRRVVEQGLTLKTLVGDDIAPGYWETFHRFYQLTYAKRSGHGGYLTREFFTETAAGMGDQVIMVVAELGERPVAAALYFRSRDTLYGRYWGCEQEFDCLHFEACYYRGIDFCIANRLQRFDPGAQGEHKIQRGFRPVQTWSSHWIADPQLSAAVADFTRREQAHNEIYLQQTTSLLPFRVD